MRHQDTLVFPEGKLKPHLHQQIKHAEEYSRVPRPAGTNPFASQPSHPLVDSAAAKPPTATVPWPSPTPKSRPGFCPGTKNKLRHPVKYHLTRRYRYKPMVPCNLDEYQSFGSEVQASWLGAAVSTYTSLTRVKKSRWPHIHSKSALIITILDTPTASPFAKLSSFLASLFLKSNYML